VNRGEPRQEDSLALTELRIDHPTGAFKPAPIIHICARSKLCGQALVCAQIGSARVIKVPAQLGILTRPNGSAARPYVYESPALGANVLMQCRVAGDLSLG
jgi:hypothetical protein